MSAITPDEYRASISASIDPLTSLQIDYDLQAASEARAFVAAHSDSKHSAEWTRFMREHDPYFSDAMTNVEVGIKSIPEPGRALLVMSSTTVKTDVDDERFWMYATDLQRVSVTTSADPCHRCFDSARVSYEPTEPNRAAWIFHVATAMYVVEFALCSDCIGRYEALAESIRIKSGDTYIEIYNE